MYIPTESEISGGVNTAIITLRESLPEDQKMFTIHELQEATWGENIPNGMREVVSYVFTSLETGNSLANEPLPVVTPNEESRLTLDGVEAYWRFTELTRGFNFEDYAAEIRHNGAQLFGQMLVGIVQSRQTETETTPPSFDAEAAA